MKKAMSIILVPLLVLGATPTVAQSTAGEQVLVNAIDMKLALIPPGKFLMGSPADEEDRDPEELQHEVVITKPFYMGVHVVTQAQFVRVMGKSAAFFSGKNGGGIDHPAEQVRWAEAMQFCDKLSQFVDEKKAGRVYRLPTEAEWEYACRAGTTSVFNGGKSLTSTQANFNGNYPYGGAPQGPYRQKTSKVGAYPPNAWGLHDMHGNVWQWCLDWYDPDYYKNSPKQDPTGPAQGVMGTGFASDYFRVIRGGSWLDEGRACRAAYRFRLQSSEPYRIVGFRVVCAAGKPGGTP